MYSFEFVKSFGHLIEVKGGDSGGKSVSRYEPAESERIVHNSFATSNRRSIARLRRVTQEHRFSCNEETHEPESLF